jgi:DNA modification methylase
MEKKHLPTSMFDPVLTEIMIKWFTREGDVVYDPFCGGTVRGEISNILKREYVGVDVRKEQIDHNKLVVPSATWITADSSEYLHNGRYDFIFTCPPYLWLENYSDHEGDLSNLIEPLFYIAYNKVIKNLYYKLNDNRFIVFVVSNVRRSDGSYSSLVSKTIDYFEELGAKFRNDCILLQEPASAAMRSFNYMNSNRTIAKNHQNVLVFVKGDVKIATRRLEKFNDVEEKKGDFFV